MKPVQVLTGIVLLSIAAAGCVRIESSSSNVVRGVNEAELKSVATANQKGDIPAAMKILEVENSLGDVRVTGVESGPLEWTWTVTARARTEAEAQEAAHAANFRAESDGDKLILTVDLPDKLVARFRSDIEIRAPKSITVRARNRYGRLSVSGFTGDVEARNQSGSIEINNVSGKVRAQNSYAVLRVKNSGPATLKNQSGSLLVEKINGPLDAETSYAELVVNDVSGFSRLRNQSGRIELAVANGADAKTSYANLKVKDIKGDAVLVNQSGSIAAESVTGLLKASTSYADLSVSGVGGPNVVLQNQSGSIHVQGLSLTATNLDARTTYAAMDVHLPSEFKPALLAQTSYAPIKSDFPLLKPEGEPFAGVPASTPRVSLVNQSGAIQVTRD